MTSIGHPKRTFTITPREAPVPPLVEPDETPDERPLEPLEPEKEPA